MGSRDQGEGAYLNAIIKTINYQTLAKSFINNKATTINNLLRCLDLHASKYINTTSCHLARGITIESAVTCLSILTISLSTWLNLLRTQITAYSFVACHIWVFYWQDQMAWRGFLSQSNLGTQINKFDIISQYLNKETIYNK